MILNEGNYTGEFLISEANGYRSRKESRTDESNTYVAGSVVQISASGDAVPYLTANAGLQVGIIYQDVGAETGPIPVFVRDCEVYGPLLVYTGDGVGAALTQSAINLELEAQGVVVLEEFEVESTQV